MKPRVLICLGVSLFGIVPLAHAQNPSPTKSPQRATVTELDFRTGKRKTVGPLTFEEIWMRSVDQRIADELAGKPPDPQVKSWRKEWQQWYESIRRSPGGVPFESLRFKTKEDLVRYIKERRKAKRLPTYDP